MNIREWKEQIMCDGPDQVERERIDPLVQRALELAQESSGYQMRFFHANDEIARLSEKLTAREGQLTRANNSADYWETLYHDSQEYVEKLQKQVKRLSPKKVKK